MDSYILEEIQQHRKHYLWKRTIYAAAIIAPLKLIWQSSYFAMNDVLYTF